MRKRQFYKTWQEASKAAIALGITKSTSYRYSYHKDPLLYSIPGVLYPDFPGWVIFLGNEKNCRLYSRDFYPTWKEALRVAESMGIRRRCDYDQRYREDPKLHSAPWFYYKDFTGFRFTGRHNRLKAKPRIKHKKAA